MRAMDGWRRWLAAGLVTAAAACGAGGGGAGEAESPGDREAAGRGREAAGRGQGATGRDQRAARPAPGMAWVVFGADTVLAEVASLPEQRERGLKNRDSVPDGTGMLFVFPATEERSFWMKDTHVALDLAFFDETYKIISIKQLEPLDETLIDSEAPTAFALEVRQGWFAERGIEVGAMAKVVFGPDLTVR